MQGWHTTFLGMRGLPRDISDFEMKAFFTFDGAERDAINARRGDSHKLGLALHIGFLRMSGRLLGAFRVIPVALWRHLGNELGIAAPEVASLRAMYERGRTLFDHQQVACTVLGFQWMSEHQRRSLVRELRDEVARCADRDQLLVRARQWLYKNKLVIVHERAILAVAALSFAAAAGVHAEEYQGVQGSVSALSRAEVQAQAVAAAHAKDQNVTRGSRGAETVAVSKDRALVQAEAVRTAHAPDQNVSSGSRVDSKVISTLQNPVDVRAAAQGNAGKL